MDGGNSVHWANRSEDGASAMGETELARARAARYRDRRVDERYEINSPGGYLNYRSAKFACEIIDVSLSGCCVRTESQFSPGSLANVEVILPILGMVLRMVGTTQWVTRDNLIGVRFMHGSARSKNQLAGLLTCLADVSAAAEVKAAIVAAARAPGPSLAVQFAEETPEAPISQQIPDEAESPAPRPTAANSVFSGPSGVQCQEDDEWPATLRFLKDASLHKGVLAGLSAEGCCLRTSKPYIGGIYLRVEVDFQMRGLPFRLGGVVENVHDHHTIDVRFLEMSSRKREELGEVIEELQKAGKPPT